MHVSACRMEGYSICNTCCGLASPAKLHRSCSSLRPGFMSTLMQPLGRRPSLCPFQHSSSCLQMSATESLWGNTIGNHPQGKLQPQVCNRS